ncbi:MAG TPA: SHOCT domain-containing protein [Candidatus Angelobacter sp.]
MWWWSQYWPMPWVFAPLMMILFMLLCMSMMWFMMGSRRHRGGNPLQILQERLARGEIGEDEYFKMKHDLES